MLLHVTATEYGISGGGTDGGESIAVTKFVDLQTVLEVMTTIQLL